MMDNNPYNTTLSVPIAQSLQGGYNNARVGRVMISLHYASEKLNFEVISRGTFFLKMPNLPNIGS